MFVGLLYVEIDIQDSFSLKDKRQVVKSQLDILRQKFNISASEIDYLDIHNRAGLGFACIGNDKQFVNSVLSRVLDNIESNPLCEVIETNLEFV